MSNSTMSSPHLAFSVADGQNQYGQSSVSPIPEAALISSVKISARPVSAISLVHGPAGDPADQIDTDASWVAPASHEKCAFGGTAPGCASSLQVLSTVSR